VNARDMTTLLHLAIDAANGEPLPALVTTLGRRVELADFLDGVERSAETPPRCFAKLLALCEPATMRDVVHCLRDQVATHGRAN
jgi:hypothetical protein